MSQEFSHCDYNCEYVEPYGFVPEAGCPIHCQDDSDNQRLTDTDAAARAEIKALDKIDTIFDLAERDAELNDNYYDFETVVSKIKVIVAGIE